MATVVVPISIDYLESIDLILKELDLDRNPKVFIYAAVNEKILDFSELEVGRKYPVLKEFEDKDPLYDINHVAHLALMFPKHTIDIIKQIADKPGERTYEGFTPFDSLINTSIRNKLRHYIIPGKE